MIALVLTGLTFMLLGGVVLAGLKDDHDAVIGFLLFGFISGFVTLLVMLL